MATDNDKLKQLCEIEGMSEEEMLSSASFDGVCVLRICQIPTLYLNGLEQ